MVVERRIFEASGQGGRWERIAKLSGNSTGYIDAGIARGQRVAYRVRAANEAGESAYSNIVRLSF
jgi:hypothetical protein